MNKVILMGRLTRDPEVRYAQGDTPLCIAAFSLAVDRYKGDTDFFDVKAFGKKAEFVEKYLVKGKKIVVCGRIENNNYTKKTGEKVYSYQVVADEIEFAESKGATGESSENEPAPAPQSDGFVTVPDDLTDAGLPFN